MEQAEHVFGNYRPIKQLGYGSFSYVYLAEHIESKERVALKVQKKKKDKVKMQRSDQCFKNEISFCNKVKQHPFIIRFIESFECEYPAQGYSPKCMVFEVGDSDINSRINQSAISEQLALTWFTQVALALAHVHKQNYMHRDVKPLNILIVGEAIGGVAKICDFGSIKIDKIGAINTITAGTDRYFPPERLHNKADYTGKADVWSLGISLYEMLTEGEHPYEDPDNLQYLQTLSNQKLKLKESISEPFQDLLRFMLVQDPMKRPLMRDVLNHPLVKNRINLMTENMIKTAAIIKEQLKEIQLAVLEMIPEESNEEQLQASPASMLNMTSASDLPFEKLKDVASLLEVSISEEDLLETNNTERIKKQLLDPVQQLPGCDNIEEQKELPAIPSQPLTTATSSQQSPYSQSSSNQQISEPSLQPVQQLLPSFTQSGLDSFLQQIRDRGHSKLVDAALLHGLTLSRLQTKVSLEVKEVPFEGNRIFKSGGIYYGECVDGKRNGYGLLYCTNNYGVPCLYECEWGATIKGGWIAIWKNKWDKYEGQFDQEYRRTGTGRWENEDGDTYIGEWKDGSMHGQGKWTYSDGAVYEGEWKDYKKHGQGKYTFPDGNYEIGTWENNEQNGVHKYYSKEGELLEKRTYKDNKLVKTEKE
ncbi:hypothetical protein FGO68_gene12814 [Halteria grandinella]|uniref:Protein kinase domain-containing protein n=1 Tax=Halteria grandinella TaxID=5974 RepID=A0A8J8NWC3_HALGN|nr:hypothetical protein FGO68_gene12814 [Halteria grandinella]